MFVRLGLGSVYTQIHELCGVSVSERVGQRFEDDPASAVSIQKMEVKSQL